ncbi:MAG TPA: AAA-like domain-containing protein, partial [Fimbriimonas sp.]|nr:AAA-like domain-containing protein [Fimbriimonas sp.]
MMTLSDGKVIACSEAFRQSLLSSGSQSHVGLPIYGRSKHGDLLIAYPLTPKKRKECLFLIHGSCWAEYSNAFANIAKYSGEIHVAWPSEGIESAAHLLSQQASAERIVVSPTGRQFDRLVDPSNWDKCIYIEAEPYVSGENTPTGARSINFSGSWLDGERIRIEILGTQPLLHVGEPVALSSPLYIERPADFELRQAVSNHESVILLRAARKFGKTSALLRAIHHAEEVGIHPVVLDLRAATKDDFQSAKRFYQWMIEQLLLQSENREIPVWEDIFGPNSNLESALRQVLAENEHGNLLVLDGVDRLFDCEFRDDFFGLLRSWHNRRALHSDPFWDSLSILLSYSAEGQSLVTDVNQSPFNVGVHLTLEPFSEDQTQELCSLVGWQGGVDVFSIAAGHPYLTAMLISRLVAGDTVESAIAATMESPLLVRHRTLLTSDEALRTACVQIMREGRTTDQPSLWR